MDIPPLKKVSPSFPLVLQRQNWIGLYHDTVIEQHTLLRVLNDKNEVEKCFTLKVSHSNPNYKSMKTTTTNYLLNTVIFEKAT